MKLMRIWVASCVLLAAGAASAQPAVVEAVQFPAWLERGGHAVPLMPGTALQPQDRLRTGGNARVLMRMGEGSAVKIGENAQFVIERAEDRGIFRATLSVIAGAFRFTTQALSKNRQRDISIKVKNVTAGIRGTDVWGKSTDARDLVCLLEGKVSVGAAGHPTVTLDQPYDFYQKPREGPPEVAKVDARQIEEWSRETEIESGGAASRVGGRWRVMASKFQTRDRALALGRTLRAQGYPAQVAQEDEIFVVQIVGLAGEPEARALMSNLRGVKGITIPAIGEMPSAMH
jgi:FecR protein/SPOR domain